MKCTPVRVVQIFIWGFINIFKSKCIDTNSLKQETDTTTNYNSPQHSFDQQLIRLLNHIWCDVQLQPVLDVIVLLLGCVMNQNAIRDYFILKRLSAVLILHRENVE